MKRLLIAGTILAASIALAACGGNDESAASAGSAKTVSVKAIGGVGDVLVDSSGKALYASDVERDGKVHCTDGCTSFWTPLTLDSGKPTATGDAGKLGVIKRPDGTRQVTADGKLLYTFAKDSPGKVEGNGFSDDFGGQHFTWNAVLKGGKLASTSSGSSDDDSGYGQGGSGGYGY